MLGRSCFSLLALFLVILVTPPTAGGQTSRVQPVPNFGLPSSVLNPPPDVPIDPIRPPVARPTPTAPIAVSLHGIGNSAGIIFSGTVTKIARVPATHGSVETVAITFHVEKAIRGATPAQELTIRQWIGLWANGQRYRIGERVLLFLYPPSKLGLTSTVGGPIGRFSVDPLNRILLTPQHLPVMRADPTLVGKSRVIWSPFTQAAMRPGVNNEIDVNEAGGNLTRLP